MAHKLPKHIAQMVEKNNLVMAFKSLADEKNISMGEAKTIIDDYEAELKQKQQQKQATIAKSQGIRNEHLSDNHNLKKDTINAGLDQYLDDKGYKKPLIPYWAKRIFVILIIILALCFVFWRLIP